MSCEAFARHTGSILLSRNRKKTRMRFPLLAKEGFALDAKQRQDIS
jgi:hypothetical protein